jgi:hypothetical protein
LVLEFDNGAFVIRFHFHFGEREGVGEETSDTGFVDRVWQADYSYGFAHGVLRGKLIWREFLREWLWCCLGISLLGG